MKIIAIEHELPGGTEKAFQDYAVDEAASAWELYQQGVVRELYFRADRPEAVFVLECPDLAAAHDALETLPFVKQGLIGFELIPLAAYPGFERLFRQPARTG